ncbi:MAG: hypothetical protein LBT33_06310, partial [Spirochaetia bacterium]|nr:hypothetical protein [Spirochaetia bacterium]
IFLKGRTSRPWAKPRVGGAKRSAAHAPGIEAEIPQTRRRRGEELERKARFWREAPKGAQKLLALHIPNNHGNCVFLRGFALLRQPGKSRKVGKPRLRLRAIALHSGRLL